MSGAMKKRSYQRLCMKGYARILRGLHDKPATTMELSEQHFVTEAVMRGLTRRLHAQNLIRVCEWRRATQGPHMRVFGFGGQPDESRPLTRDGKVSQHIGATRPPPKPTSEIIAFATLLRALTDSRGLAELHEITGIGAHSLSRNLKYMVSIGLLHVADWERRRIGAPLPLYRIGIDKPNRAAPAPMSKRARNERYGAARRDRRHTLIVLRALSANSSVFYQAA